MKTKVISLTIASIMSLQSTSFAASSRVDGIGDTQILAAKKEIMTLRHDILRLDQALAETADAIKERQEKGNIASSVSVAGAVLGLGLAALSVTVAKVGADSGVGSLLAIAGFGVAAVKTSSSAALRLLSELQRGSGSTEVAGNALEKARQEILAARATEALDSKSEASLNQLDQSLEAIQNSLEQFQDREDLNKSARLTAMLSQAAGAAITFYAVAGAVTGNGLSKTGAILGPILMTVGNITAIASVLSPSKADSILAEIAQTRQALNVAAAKLAE